jgi:hypothetical protein
VVAAFLCRYQQGRLVKAGRATLLNKFIFELAATMMTTRPICLFTLIQPRPSSHYDDIAFTKLEQVSAVMTTRPAKRDSSVKALRNVDVMPNEIMVA